ncbi:hypothetical protein GUA87_03650 [Sneathiella sp. P13V-1]|uniref:hypothetical protein n=1 Tax=Sneathiella sp. P13V-1 TaxID=2697366 RepID=UPI00187B65C9|nr:hypothetical protein [Sneathiella sp. P13V-1]MBE7635924.1 hypothetical protein [Sneathiella sp. P13V-1]
MGLSRIAPIGLLMSAVVLSSCKAETENAAAETSGKYSQKIPARMLIEAPSSGVELGMGWDSRRGEIIPNHCIDFSPIRSSGQEITMDLKEVSDQSEVMDSLNVSAAVEAKSIVASGSAKASFAKSRQVNSSSTTILLNAQVNNGVLFVGPPALPGRVRNAYPGLEDEKAGMGFGNAAGLRPHSRKSDYSSPEVSFKPFIRAKVKSPDRFREHCGDYYVSAIYSGAELIATINFSAKSVADAKIISASVKAKYGSVSASAASKQTQKSKSDSTDFNIHFLQIGGAGGEIPTSKDDLLEKLKSLPTEASKDPKFHKVELRSYREIPDADSLVFTSNEDAFEIITDYYWMLTSVYEDLENVISNMKGYHDKTSYSVKDFKEIQDEILDVRRALFEISNAYYTGRLPDQALLDKVDRNWFPNAPEEKFRLDLPSILRAPGEKGELEGNCPVETWFNCVADKLKTAMPSGNPNVIKLLLPLPNKVTIPTATDEMTAEQAYQKAVIDWYIRPQSKRMCALDPTDNECMSNTGIDALADLIPYKE